MRVAVVSEDGKNVSQHFGRAPFYVVLTVEEGRVENRETRDKTGHHTFAAHQHPDLTPGEHHGYDAGAQVRHNSMAETIADCQVLIAGGMGQGAYENMKSRNIEAIVTDIRDIEEAVKLYIKGELPNRMERLH